VSAWELIVGLGGGSGLSLSERGKKNKKGRPLQSMKQTSDWLH